MARVTMKPKALTSEMLSLIEAQADNAEVFTLPGDVAAQLAQLAQRGLAAETPESAARPVTQATRKAPGERTALSLVDATLLDTAQQMVRFLSLEQRNALRVALVEAL
jgi:hypothetical protein